jgi:hypothetical protein
VLVLGVAGRRRMGIGRMMISIRRRNLIRMSRYVHLSESS